jgi:hypothetical protein
VRHVRMLGLCLAAALALGAYAVASASALEWGKCENVGSGGNYAGPNCSKAEKAKPKGTGSYEWRKASEVASKRVAEGKSANVPFAGESIGGGGVLTTGLRECYVAGGEPEHEYIRTTRQGCKEAGGEETSFGEEGGEPLFVECANEKNTGEAEAKNKIANVHVLFTGCAALGALPCNSEGKEEGEVETNPLKGKLGWINKSAKEVGVLLEPAAHHGAFAEFECSGFLATVVGVGNKKTGAEYTSAGCYGPCPGTTPEEEKHGGYDEIISPISPVNQMTSEYTQVYTQEAEYPWKNIPSHFENKHLSVLEDYLIAVEANDGETMWSPAGEEITNVNTPEEEGEIKA